MYFHIRISLFLKKKKKKRVRSECQIKISHGQEETSEPPWEISSHLWHLPSHWVKSDFHNMGFIFNVLFKELTLHS